MKYSQAPISEVIFGITFKDNTFSSNNILFEILAEFKNEYKQVLLLPPLADHELQENTISTIFNPGVTGPSLYRLRTPDNTWLIQVQNNKLYLNWVRGDDEEPGHYPGFSEVRNKFYDIYSSVQKKLDGKIDIKYLELTYQDRVYWDEHIRSLGDIKKLINLSLPNISAENPQYSTINSQFTVPFSELQGYALVTINTFNRPDGRQILSYQNELRGSPKKTIEDWFESAHSIQLSSFENLFTKETLEKWR